MASVVVLVENASARLRHQELPSQLWTNPEFVVVCGFFSFHLQSIDTFCNGAKSLQAGLSPGFPNRIRIVFASHFFHQKLDPGRW